MLVFTSKKKREKGVTRGEGTEEKEENDENDKKKGRREEEKKREG